MAVNFDYRFANSKTARSRDSAIRDAILGVPPALLPAVGSDSGVAFAALPADVQESLILALRPPFSVSRQTANGMSMPDDAGKPTHFAEELDPRTLRFRMRLRAAPPMLRSSTGPSYSGEALDSPAGARTFLGIDPATSAGQFSLRAVLQVPNKYKATDLDGAKYIQPLGIHGLQTVSAILQRVERLTGVKVHARDTWASVCVYIGSEAITCGETLDGLRLIFTGSWRKVGNLYFLSWDREGMRSVQYRWSKAAGPVMEAVEAADLKTINDKRWFTIALTAPFAPDDPVRWSDEQRQALFGARPIDKKNPFAPRPPIFYPQMAPEQQAIVRQTLISDSSNPPATRDSTPSSRALTPDELSRVALSESVDLEAEVSIPGIGWAQLPRIYTGLLSANQIDIARFNLQNQAEAPSRPDTRPTYRVAMTQGGYSAHVPVARQTVVMLPALAPAKLASVAAGLKTLGVTTVVYPLLYNGYATLPGTGFPLDPALKGAAGWSAAVKVAKAHGLRILGSVNVLEWRAPGRSKHWLDAEPSWLDIDDTGRTRSQWFASLETSRLDYRVAMVLQQGKDPIDEPAPIVSFKFDWAGVPEIADPSFYVYGRPAIYAVGSQPVQVQPRDPAEMASRLMDGFVERARKASPGLKVWLVKEGSDQSGRLANRQINPMPAADTYLYTWAQMGLGVTADVLLRIPPKAAVDADPQIPPDAKPWPALAVVLADTFRWPILMPKSPSMERLVYDFRAATDDPVASIKWTNDQATAAQKARDEAYAKLRKPHPPAVP
jgi:hypothetical protein